MAYSEFTLSSVKNKFGLILDENTNLFNSIATVSISEYLSITLEENIPLALAIATEKARSELIIAPMLVQLRKLMQHRISLFSGIEFIVDETQGLNGICDFILSQSPEQLILTAPVIMLVEAKNENMKRGYGQCIAEMIAAQIFNAGEGIIERSIYGVVTTGNIWRFLVLKENTVQIDSVEYYISQPDKIMGILLSLIVA